jgi:LmbE family N-acetylglucosaminyl deacetylase
MSELHGRVVVVSPHLDDAVFSLGATIARAVRRGADIQVLTVLAGSTESLAPAGRWDARSGYETEGAAARARREEDRRACEILGAAPRWLSYGDDQYERHGDDRRIRDDLVDSLRDADTALLPGFPLRHPDHAWLVPLVLGDAVPCRRIGLYLELPYATRTPGTRSGEAFDRVRVSPRDRLTKWRAVREYKSQLPHLGSLVGGTHGSATRLIWAEWRAEGEGVAWLPDGYRWGAG